MCGFVDEDTNRGRWQKVNEAWQKQAKHDQVVHKVGLQSGRVTPARQLETRPRPWGRNAAVLQLLERTWRVMDPEILPPTKAH
ncbi:hypothetical protein ColTof3_10384 [Colletotrichum tofieldiae]|nr:hypothetical protein ColTof3_10384 [Colletotrichum tofieldiae]